MKAPFPERRLGEILREVNDEFPVDPAAEYRGAGVLSYGRGLFDKGRFAGSETRYPRLKRLHEGQLVFSRLFAWEGAFAVVTPDFDGVCVSQEFPSFEVARAADVRWVHLCVSRRSFWESLVGAGLGQRRRRVQPGEFLSKAIPLPQLAEQRRIIERIEAIADRLEEVRRLAHELANEAGVFERTSARVLVERIDPSTSVPLGELVTTAGGGTPSKANPAYWGGEIPWVSPKDMKVRELHDSIDHITDLATLESPAKKIAPGAVLVVVRGMILAHTVPSAVLRVPAAINQDMKALTPTDRVESGYLCAALWALNDRLLELVEKSTHDTRRLDTGKLLSLRIPAPSKDVQRRVAECLARQRSAFVEARMQRAGMLEAADALLPAFLDRVLRTAERPASTPPALAVPATAAHAVG